MPVASTKLFNESHPAWKTIAAKGVPVNEGDGQGLRIGLLNLMPAAARDNTVAQFLGLLGYNPVNLQPVLIRFDKYTPKTGRDEHLQFYEPFADVRANGLDALIVTGANLEITQDSKAILPVSEVVYADELREVLDWARKEVPRTIYSCWGAHFALEHFYGWARTPLGNTTFNKFSDTRGQAIKTFGLFVQDVDHSVCPALTQGMNERIWIPQSRWGDQPLEEMPEAAKKELKVVASSPQSGWHMLIGPGVREIYLNGHPEYYARDLESEYVRDKKKGMNPRLPVTYFPNDDDTKAPEWSWLADAHVFYRNWICMVMESAAKSPQSRRRQISAKFGKMPVLISNL